MLFFIPAWYKQNSWCENEQSWHVRRVHTEFDDTVKQIQLFHRNATYPYRIMLLSFSPNFRHFLHRQGVYHAPYWSCFDAIQEVKRKKARLLSIHNLSWPKEIEFIYTPFVMMAMLKGQKYAQVEYGEDGNPIQIDLFENGKIVRRNIYDDRGFVASTIVYEKEIPVYQDYLMESGIWKLRSYFADGNVEVNPKYPYYLIQTEEENRKKFSKLQYGSMDEIIYEVLISYINLTEENDIFCVAMHERHTEVLEKALVGKKLLLSFFDDRYTFRVLESEIKLMEMAAYVITDSPEHTQLLKENSVAKLQHITDITPFDTRMDSGISQQLSVQNILLPVDGMTDEHLSKIIGVLGKYCLKNKNARICLFTRQADYNKKQLILEKTREALKIAGLQEGWAFNQMQQSNAENNMEDEETVPVKFYVEQCVEEIAVSKCMKEQRVIVDLREIPELYLQIMAVSIGIPQILREENKFAKNGGNCYVIHNLQKLPTALEFYLDGLANWNEAQVYSYKLGKKYTTSVLLAKWKEVIENIE